jgi:hypothetical protein
MSSVWKKQINLCCDSLKINILSVYIHTTRMAHLKINFRRVLWCLVIFWEKRTPWWSHCAASHSTTFALLLLNQSQLCWRLIDWSNSSNWESYHVLSAKSHRHVHLSLYSDVLHIIRTDVRLPVHDAVCIGVFSTMPNSGYSKKRRFSWKYPTKWWWHFPAKPQFLYTNIHAVIS